MIKNVNEKYSKTNNNNNQKYILIINILKETFYIYGKTNHFTDGKFKKGNR